VGFLQRGSSAERYVSTPGFLLLIFPSGFTLSYVFSSNSLSRLAVIAVIALVIFSGSVSLNWAPDLYPNPTFEFSSITEYVVASNLAHHIPVNSSIGAVLAISDPLSSNLALTGTHFTQIRPFYDYIAANREVDSCTIQLFASPNSLFAVGLSSLAGSCQNAHDVVFNSGTYVVIMTPKT